MLHQHPGDSTLPRLCALKLALLSCLPAGTVWMEGRRGACCPSPCWTSVHNQENQPEPGWLTLEESQKAGRIWGEVPHCVDRDSEALTSRDSALFLVTDLPGEDTGRAERIPLCSRKRAWLHLLPSLSCEAQRVFPFWRLWGFALAGMRRSQCGEDRRQSWAVVLPRESKQCVPWGSPWNSCV